MIYIIQNGRLLDTTEFVKHVHRMNDFYIPYQSVRDYVISITIEDSNISSIEIEDYFTEKIIKKYKSELIKQKSNREKKGFFNCYDLIEQNSVIIGSSVPRDTDHDLLKEVRKIMPIHEKMLSIIRDTTIIDDDQFEIFSNKIVRELGSDDSLKTAASGDNGVDFIGHFKTEKFHKLVKSQNLPNNVNEIPKENVLIVGQSKRYSERYKVGVGELRELIGSIEIVKHDHASMLEILNLSEGSDFFLQKYYSQILPVFFTTSSFTSGAMELAKNFGIILKDGFEMATFTCMIDKFHIIENNKVMDIDIDAFLNWYLN